MIKCYHARRIELVIDSEPQLFYQGRLITPLIAVIDSDEEELEDIWDACNNSCWWDREDFRSMTNYKDKFGIEFTKDYNGFCNNDLIVEMNGKYHVAKSHGWEEEDTFEEAVEYCREHAYWCTLRGKNYQHPTGEEHSDEELEEIKRTYEEQGYRCRIVHS